MYLPTIYIHQTGLDLQLLTPAGASAGLRLPPAVAGVMTALADRRARALDGEATPKELTDRRSWRPRGARGAANGRAERSTPPAAARARADVARVAAAARSDAGFLVDCPVRALDQGGNRSHLLGPGATRARGRTLRRRYWFDTGDYDDRQKLIHVRLRRRLVPYDGRSPAYSLCKIPYLKHKMLTTINIIDHEAAVRYGRGYRVVSGGGGGRRAAGGGRRAAGGGRASGARGPA
ncbi:hypothetical protein EVAR_43213_1 [Eumeta japonica]|uniref:Uncharacterized protein n=1 Tax=Eumeta variegata TaxID=151549 RepID=A0A4C1WS29_EUMVA|nr:hypothetical protein EVAR_43213_1 [Eumeta japonica]